MLRQQGVLDASVYVDDKAALLESQEALQQVLALTSSCCQPWGMTLNLSKCVLVVNELASHWRPPPVASSIPSQYSAKLLGVMIGMFAHPAAQTRTELTLQKMITALDKLRCLAMDAWHRRHIISSCILPRLYFPTFISVTSDGTSALFRFVCAEIKDLLWGTKRYCAAPELIYSHIYPGHQVHPLLRYYLRTLYLLWDIFHTRHLAAFMPLLRAHCQGAMPLTVLNPMQLPRVRSLLEAFNHVLRVLLLTWTSNGSGLAYRGVPFLLQGLPRQT